MPIGLLVKLVAGTIFLSIYTVYYGDGQLTADAGKFLEEGKILNNVFYDSPKAYFQFLFNLETHEMVMHYLSETIHWSGDPSAIMNDSKNLVKIYSIFDFISFGYAPINLLLTNFISLFGVFHIYKAFQPYVKLPSNWLFFILLLAPSTLFWSSGLLKEPFLFFGLGLFCRALLIKDSNIKRGAFFIFGAIFLVGFKPYTLVAIVLSIFVYYLFQFYKKRSHALGIVASSVIAVCIWIYNSGETKFVQLISAKQSDFIGISKGGTYMRNDSVYFIFTDDQMQYFEVRDTAYYLQKEIEAEYVFPYDRSAPKKAIAVPNSHPWWYGFRYASCGSYIPVTYIDHSSEKLIRNIPEAIFNATFRPLVNDPGSNLKYFATAELILLFGFIVFAILKRRILSRKEFSIVMTLLTFALAILLLIGWTTPVLGAIVRYRFPAYIAIGLIGLIVVDYTKIWKR